MQIRIISTTGEFLKIKEDWERLQLQDEDVTYYSTFEYNWTWWEVYKNDMNKKLFILAVEANGAVVGIAPLIIEKVNKKILSYRKLRFLGKGDYLGIIIGKTTNVKDGNIVKEIFNFIEAKNQYFESIILTHIKNESKLAAYILRNKRYNKSFTYLIECPVLKYEKFNTYDAYKNKFVTKNDNRYINKFQMEVGYNFKVAFNNKEEVYEKISQLHMREQDYLSKNKGRKERKSLYKDAFFSKFIKNLYSNNPKVITFEIEDSKGNLLIYSTCYLYKRVLHSWNLAYDPKYEKYHLGKIINLEMIKYIFENNIADILDFGAGRYPWKFEWTNDFIFNYQLEIWNEKSIKGKLLKKYMLFRKIIFMCRQNG